MYNTLIKAYLKLIKDVKTNGNHVTELLSHSDLIQLAGASAVEYCGGPFIPIKYLYII